jgi:hypothetical protein
VRPDFVDSLQRRSNLVFTGGAARLDRRPVCFTVDRGIGVAQPKTVQLRLGIAGSEYKSLVESNARERGNDLRRQSRFVDDHFVHGCCQRATRDYQ